MSKGNAASRTTGNLRAVGDVRYLNDIGTLVNKQIAYLLGISLETDQIRVGKIFMYVIAEGLVQTGSIEAVSIKAVLVQQGLLLMD